MGDDEHEISKFLSGGVIEKIDRKKVMGERCLRDCKVV